MTRKARWGGSVVRGYHRLSRGDPDRIVLELTIVVRSVTGRGPDRIVERSGAPGRRRRRLPTRACTGFGGQRSDSLLFARAEYPGRFRAGGAREVTETVPPCGSVPWQESLTVDTGTVLRSFPFPPVPGRSPRNGRNGQGTGLRSVILSRENIKGTVERTFCPHVKENGGRGP